MKEVAKSRGDNEVGGDAHREGSRRDDLLNQIGDCQQPLQQKRKRA